MENLLALTLADDPPEQHEGEGPPFHWRWLGRGVLDEDDPPVLETARAVGQHLPHHLGHGLAHGRDGHDPLEVEVAVIVEKRVIGQSLYLFQNLFDRDVFLGNANRGGGSLRPSSRGQKKQ